jgi:hypothetical protein
VDFFTFIIIAVFLYNIFSKKDKPPRRGQRSAEDPQRTPPPGAEREREIAREVRPQRGGLFENLERQIREASEKLEKELQGERSQPQKPAPVKTYRRTTEQPRSKVSPPQEPSYQETEGVWGDEGRSNYDKYVSKQGTAGVEGTGGVEGTWGTEGRDYADRWERTSEIEQSEIGVGPGYSQERYAGALGFSSSEIVQGIIWAEVLKEPKGRRAMSRR